MFHSFAETPESLTQLIAVIFGFYIVVSISQSVAFSGAQALDFPLVNRANSNSTAFISVIILLVTPMILGCRLSFGFSNEDYSYLYSFILLCFALCFWYISSEFVSCKRVVNFEYDLLLSFSLFGLLLVAVCSDFLCFYLAIELQSLCFYALSTFHKSSEYSAEAGVKYFILGAFSSGLLLLGFNLFYAFFGDLSYAQIEKVGSFAIPLTVVGGYLFFSASLLFKLGSFPFHMWLCDVYDGAMVNITAFFSIIPKVIILAFLIRALSVVFVEKPDAIKIMFVVCGLCSVCFASIAALYQKRVKRLLAYSTISHTGFMILGICCYSADGVKACTVYITLYVIMLLATFGVVFLSGTYKAPQKYLVNWTSALDRNVCNAFAFGILLYSLAGIPPLSGFYSKLGILVSLLSKTHIVISTVVVIFSSIACFYYIKLVKIFSFVPTSKDLFWFDGGTKNVESFIGFALFVVGTCLFRPDSLLEMSIGVATIVV